MVNLNRNDQEADLVIVGGGHASADIIPYLCESLGSRVRGVVFIDHDIEEIDALARELEPLDVTMSYVVLQKRSLEQEIFTQLVEENELTENTSWGDDLTNHPPMIRMQLKLRSKDLLSAVWDMLPTRNDVLVLPRATIVFVFGMTGMTSSTVAIEAGELIRKEITRRILNVRADRPVHAASAQSPIDVASPRHVGIGLFPPNPMEGAGDYNLLQGLNAANALNYKLPQRAGDLDECPFDKFLFIDGSDFNRTQSLRDFDEWASRTASTLLTCETVTGESFFDTNEMLNEISPYNNLALILAGGGPEDIAAANYLERVSADVIPQVESGDTDTLDRVTDDLLSESLPSQLTESGVNDAIRRVQDSEDTVAKERDNLRERRSTAPPLNKWPMIVGFLLCSVAASTISFMSKGGELILRLLEFEETIWLVYVVVAATGVVAGIIGFFIGALLSFVVSQRNKGMAVAVARESVARSETRRTQTLRSYGADVRKEADRLRERWQDMQHRRMWVMPNSNDPSLPVQNPDESGADDRGRFNERLYVNQNLQNTLRYIINPEVNFNVRVRRGTAVVAGSQSARDTFPLPRESLQSAFGGDWRIRYGEGDLDDKIPIHYLLFWEPDDGKIMPRYYRENANYDLGELPAEFNAWPNFWRQSQAES